MAEDQPGLTSSQQIMITLEVVPEDPRDADPALVEAVGRHTTEALRNVGYTIEQVYTGQRGGFLVAVIPLLNTIAAIAWAQKDVILGDLNALVTILGAVAPTIKYLRNAYERRVGKDTSQQEPIKITLEIDGTPILVEVPDVESAEDILKLAQRIQASHPTVAAKVTPQSKAKIKGSVPKRRPRKRR